MKLWDKDKIYKSGDDIENMVRSDSDDFLAFDDGYLDKLIDKYASRKKDKQLAALCKAVKLRKPPKLVYEISELTEDDNPPRVEYTILKKNWSTMVKELSKEEGIEIPEWRWIFRDIKGPEFEKFHPFISLAEARDLMESDVQELRELVRIKGRSGETKILVADKSSVLHYMSRLKPTLCRVYVLGIDDKMAGQIRAKIEKRLQP